MSVPASIGTGVGRDEFDRLTRTARWHILSTVARRKAGHVGGPLSATDMLVALYFGGMRIDPDHPADPDRDRFILSKGHCAIGLYSVLALRGYLPVEELATFDEAGSRLQAHPDATRLPGLDASTGSLGQGLSVGLGHALAAKLSKRNFHTWVMLGDGELQEGMVWEAVHMAPRYRLGNLIAVVDVNGLQQFGWDASERSRGDRRDPWEGARLADVFRAFGWAVLQLDGHDYDDITSSIRAAQQAADGDKPTVLLSRTVKGHGISFVEGRHRWHNGIATDEELTLAWQELHCDELEGVQR